VARGLEGDFFHSYTHSTLLSVEAVFASLGNQRPWEENRDEMVRLVLDRIRNWDVRRAGVLRDLFPSHFPAALRRGTLHAEYDDSGEWVLYTPCPSKE